MKPSFSKLAVLALLLASCTPTYQKPAPVVQAPVAGGLPPAIVEQPTVPSIGVIPAGAPAVKVALLLPLSGDSVAVGNAMLDAATMALSDSYLTTPSSQIHNQVVLLPKDTGNTPADSAKAMEQAVDQGATFIVGPLFSQSVGVVAPVAREHHLDMLTFSNNRAVAGNGVYLFGFLPEQQVTRIAEYAYLHGLQRVAILAPNDSYGEKVKTTLLDTYSKKGGAVSPIELYAPSPSNIDAAVARLAGAYKNATEDHRFQAIFIADGGNQLRDIIEAIKKNHIDLGKVKLLGTGLWDDMEIARIPELKGAWFPSSTPDAYQIFEKRFVATYGYKPVRLASLAYDAVMLTTTLSMTPPGAITAEALTNPNGYMSPANGLFRLNADGTSERKLAIMEVTGGDFKVIDPAAKHF